MCAGYAIVVDGLVKRYGNVYALRGLSFTVHRGEVYGLLGPNGAGKTTTIRALAGALRPTRGRILVEGIDPAREPVRVKEVVGVVPELPSLFPELTVEDNLRFIAGVYRLPRGEAGRRIRGVLESLGLEEVAKRRYGSLSKGLRRRVDIAAALLHDPPVLLLDEPTGGLDVLATARLREEIARLSRGGKTILISSHNIEEVMNLSARVLILVRGAKVVEGPPSMLRRVVSRRRVRIFYRGALTAPAAERLRARLASLGVEHVEVGDGRTSFLAPRVAEALEEALSALRSAGVDVVDVEVLPPSWEDVFRAHVEAAETSGSPCGGCEAGCAGR